MTNLINEDNKISRWPSKRRDKDVIIKWLASKFETNKIYTEKEVNEIINQHHRFNDFALLRRELISKKYLMRKSDGSDYWKSET